MARKKNGGDQTPQAGHNSTLTDEERRALTLHHKAIYEAADALVEKAKKDRESVGELAKADLGKSAVKDIKEMILAGTPEKMKGIVERTLRLARWAGMPVGTQPQLFEPVIDHTEEGKTAGMSGLSCEPPKHLAVDAQQKWIAGWHEGQTVLASAFKKKREPEQAAPPPPKGGDQHEAATAH